MTEKQKYKEAEKSQRTLSFNWKEEMLLRKKIFVLNSVKKQVWDSVTLDQKVLYNRFRNKLRRSELAHARIMGNKEQMKQMKYNSSPSLNTVVTDDTEKVVKEIIQNYLKRNTPAELSRSKSGITEVAGNFDVKATSEPGDIDSRAYSVLFRNDEDNFNDDKAHTSSQIFEGQNDLKYNGKILNMRPHTTKINNIQQRKNAAIVKRPQTVAVTMTANNERRLPVFSSASECSMRTMANSPHVRNGNAESRKQQFSVLKSASNANRNEANSDFRCIFLNIGKTEEKKQPVSELHAAQTKEADLDGKVKQFIRTVEILEQQNSAQDYYSDRLAETMGKKQQKAALTLTSDVELEWSKWCPFGHEPNYRSVTVKKLDKNFKRKDIPPEVLSLESYNAVKTRENMVERNWINNNPY